MFVQKVNFNFSQKQATVEFSSVEKEDIEFFKKIYEAQEVSMLKNIKNEIFSSNLKDLKIETIKNILELSLARLSKNDLEDVLNFVEKELFKKV